jgi:hypothetical protein
MQYRQSKLGTCFVFAGPAAIRLYASRCRRMNGLIAGLKNSIFRPSNGKFRSRGITVQAAAKIPVVLHCAFVKFVAAIVELFAVIAKLLHLIGR